MTPVRAPRAPGPDHALGVLVIASPAPHPDSAPPALTALGGSRLVERLVATLEETGLGHVLVAAPASHAPEIARVLGSRAQVLAVAATGRAAAIRAALPHLPRAPVLVHDAERALTPPETVRTVLAALEDGVDAVVPALPVTDSVKASGRHGLRNVERDALVSLQAPRLLRRDLLEAVVAEGQDAGAPGAGDPAAEGPRSAGPSGPGRAGPSGPGREAPGIGPDDEIARALARGARVRRVPGSHRGFAISDRLGLWEAQISLGLARDVGGRRRGQPRPV